VRGRPTTGTGSSDAFSGGAPAANAYSSNPVRYFDGGVKFARTDLSSPGFGSDFSITRSFNNVLNTDQPLESSAVGLGPHWHGTGWYINGLSRLFQEPEVSGRIVLSNTATDRRFFDQASDDIHTRTYNQLFGGVETLLWDKDNSQFVLTDAAGDQTTYYDFTASANLQGKFHTMTDPDGRQTTASYNTDGTINTVSRQAVVGSDTLHESFVFSYTTFSDEIGPLITDITSITQQRWKNTETAATVREVEYEYSDDGALLERATVKQPAPSTLKTVNVEYYRYTSNDLAGHQGLDPKAIE